MVLYGPWTAALVQGTAVPLISSLERAMIHPHRLSVFHVNWSAVRCSVALTRNPVVLLGFVVLSPIET